MRFLPATRLKISIDLNRYLWFYSNGAQWVRSNKETPMTKFAGFWKDEAAAVTVDWVVLTAAIIGLGLLVFNWVRPAPDTEKEVPAANP